MHVSFRLTLLTLCTLWNGSEAAAVYLWVRMANGVAYEMKSNYGWSIGTAHCPYKTSIAEMQARYDASCAARHQFCINGHWFVIE